MSDQRVHPEQPKKSIPERSEADPHSQLDSVDDATVTASDYDSTIQALLRKAASLSEDQRQEFLAGLSAEVRAVVQALVSGSASLPGKPAQVPELDGTVIGDVPGDHSEQTFIPALSSPSVDWPNIASSSGYSNEKQSALELRFGPYVVEESLASGAFGDVYRCHDERLNRDVAVKVPRLDKMTEHVVQEFQQEAQQLAQLDHSGIVKVHDFDVKEGTCYIVSEYVPGPDLNRWRRESKPHWIAICHVVAQIADALAYSHSRKTVHRDIKPANIRLKEGGRPVLLDFGLAISRTLGNATEGLIAGTPPYMSPEQIQAKGHRIDGRTDIYSLGVTLYQLLTGQLPFQSKNRNDLFREILQDDPQPPRQLVHEIPVALEHVCLKAMQRLPEARYSTAADMASDIRKLLTAEGVDSVQGSWTSSQSSATIVIRRPAFRIPTWSVPVGVGVFVLAIVALLWRGDKADVSTSLASTSSNDLAAGSPAVVVPEPDSVPAVDAQQLVQELQQRLEQARRNMQAAQTWQLQGNLQRAQTALTSVLDDLDHVVFHERFAELPESDRTDSRLRWATAMIRYSGTIDQNNPRDAQAADENLNVAIRQLEAWLTSGDSLQLKSDLTAALGMAWANRAELNCFAAALDRTAATSMADAAIRELRVLPRNTTDAFFRRELANSLKTLGRVATALHRYQNAADDLRRALQIFQSLVELEQAVGNVDVDYLIGRAETLTLLAGLLDKLGQKQEARQRFVEAVRDFEQLREVAPDLAGLDRQRVALKANFASFLQSLGLSTQARPELEEALAMIEQMPPDLRAQSELQEISIRSLLAEVAKDCGRTEVAQAEADRVLQSLTPRSSDDRVHSELALALMTAGRIGHADGRLADATTLLTQATEICEKLRKQNPADQYFVDLHAWAHEHTGRLQLANGAQDLAEDAFRNAYSLRQKLAETGDAGYVLQMVRFLANCELESMRDPEAALRHLDAIEAQVQDHETFRQRKTLALFRAGRYPEVVAALQSPETDATGDRSGELFILAISLTETGDFEKANTALQQAVRSLQRNRPGSYDMRQLQQEAEVRLAEK